ncbi:MAG TPA: HlyD family secretion protein [Opitutaceae bacterium]|nr:HlyD family secretion protein [Opitutaceae bacterium]
MSETGSHPSHSHRPVEADEEKSGTPPQAHPRHGHRSEGKSGHDQREHHGQRGKPVRPWYRRPLLAGGLFLVLLILVVGGTLLALHARAFESTDDASIDVIPQRASAQLPGRVLRVAVADNQEVAEGAVLVELDPADYVARAEQARAAGAQAQAQAGQARAQRAIFDAQREQAQASLAIAETNADTAAKDLARFDALRRDNAGAVSQQQWDNAVAAQKSSAAQVEAARKAVAAAEAQLGSADSLLDAAKAAQAGADAQLRQAELNLSYMQVRARVAGRVASLHVAPGDYVQPGGALMAIVPREVYVTANFKETQLRRMRRGQPVRVTVDAYPDFELAGRIDSFQPGTGQTFSSLPAENATGNWVKVVQRVPVKITLDHVPDDPDRRLGPGMSAEVRVSVR